MADDYETPIDREQTVLGNIAKHFNNQETSDVTLTVSEKSYHVHRFILAAQSSVFHTMLMNGQWKESDEKVIKLEESPEGELVFGDFLKFFYTGKLSLSCSNVCGIHMLADSYDLPEMKEDAVFVMKNVLTGVQGKAYPSAIVWLPYIEQFIPDLLPICYEAVRTNFYGCTDYSTDKLIAVLESRHIQEILKKNEVAVHSEFDIFLLIMMWATLRFKNLSGQKAKKELIPILQLIRFHNMDSEELQEVEESTLCKAIGKSFITDYIHPAHKVRSEMLHIVSNSYKKQLTASGVPYTAVAGDCKCQCDHNANCPHLNPRLYVKSPYGLCGHFITSTKVSLPVKPIDLADLGMYAKLLTHPEESTSDDGSSWRVEWKGDYKSSQQYDREKFTVKPAPAHIGRRCTVAINLAGPKRNNEYRYRYAIKHTCTIYEHIVLTKYGQAEPIIVYSPKRSKGLWETDLTTDRIFLGVAVHLHKQ